MGLLIASGVLAFLVWWATPTHLRPEDVCNSKGEITFWRTLFTVLVQIVLWTLVFVCAGWIVPHLPDFLITGWRLPLTVFASMFWRWFALLMVLQYVWAIAGTTVKTAVIFVMAAFGCHLAKQSIEQGVQQFIEKERQVSIELNQIEEKQKAADMNPQASHGAIRFGRETTLKWQVSEGDCVLWVRWKDPLDSTSTVNILDFWEMKDGDVVTITNRIEDLPPWFELHPTEVTGSAAYRGMQKLESGHVPGDAVEGPNLWRVRTGDRMVWVCRCGGETPSAHRIQALLDFDANALTFGESGDRAEALASFLSFGAPTRSTQHEEAVALLRAGLEAVKELGLPRAIEEGQWALN